MAVLALSADETAGPASPALVSLTGETLEKRFAKRRPWTIYAGFVTLTTWW
jgi:hypothetical protein